MSHSPKVQMTCGTRGGNIYPDGCHHSEEMAVHFDFPNASFHGANQKQVDFMSFVETACNAHEDLVKALEAASRIELLRNDLSENYTRLNEKKGTVESIQTSKANVTRLNAELSKIRTQIKEALAKAGAK